MLKSLFAGVSGLQSHQVAMDVESNNIANVNTTGFKYSRANFSDLLAQTKSIATAPQGELGGKNAVQVGLGSTVSSMTRIFSQGSIQNSDKNTDVAIQGDGLFIVSGDGGNTYKYTRAGDFKFDAGGNFVDNSGFVVQGWERDDVTGKVDSTGPITSISIPPGLTTPASPTVEVVVKANLNAGTLIQSYSPAYSVASTTLGSAAPSAIDENGQPISSGDMGVLFNDNGEAFSLQEGQGIWASFYNSTVTSSPIAATVADAAQTVTFQLDDGSTEAVNFTFLAGNSGTQNANIQAAAINTKTSITGVSAAVDPATLAVVLTNDNGNPSASHNINIVAGATATTGFDTFGVSEATAFKYVYKGAGGDTSASAVIKEFSTIASLREALELEARNVGDSIAIAAGGTEVSTATATIAGVSNAATFVVDGVTVRVPDTTGGLAQTAIQNGTTYATYISAALTAAGNTNTTVTDNGDGTYDIDSVAASTINIKSAGATGLTGAGTADENNISVSINAQGKFELENPGGSTDGDYAINLRITGVTDTAAGITENSRFTTSMSALNTTLAAGSAGKSFSQAFNAATHSSSIDIYDSLGSKHTLRTEFRKTALSTTTGSTWSLKVTVPEPATIDTVYPYNEKQGSIRFNNDGSLSVPDPTTIAFSANNGSAPEQQVSLNFGSTNAFDGMTSFDAASSTSGISQDGFTGGDLVGIRIDQSGTLVGSFSNGRSFGLAQISMAKFTNNEGLATEGGNIFIQTANSGDPIIGTAATSGRGFIQSAALEASNVDLSRALTQLIIIQRGFQANGKTITTSDQLLQTLIGLKN